jgi:hypothetical protein
LRPVFLHVLAQPLCNRGVGVRAWNLLYRIKVAVTEPVSILENLMKKLLVALLVLAPLHANAVLITSSVGTYDVTYTNVKGDSGSLDDQVWWGSLNLAREFAALVGNKLGWLNDYGNVDYGAFFAYSNSGDYTEVAAFNKSGSVDWGPIDEDNRWDFAIAHKVASVPEPGTLSLIGAGLLGLGLLRRRRAA